MLLYYITDRRQFPGSEREQQLRLLDHISAAARAGVNYVQLRERDLSGRELEALARAAVAAVGAAGTGTKLLVNSRVDVALATGADGVHLRSDDPSSSDARAMAASRTQFILAVSCHSDAEVRLAWSHGASFAVFAPVFEKNGRPGAGLPALRSACQAAPGFVLALGGINRENAGRCLAAGAAGVAAIRLFQEDEVARTVAQLRSLEQG